MSLQTLQEWEQKTGLLVAQAQQSHRRANRQRDHSRQTHNDTSIENIDRYASLRDSLEVKITDSTRLVSALQRRAEDLQTSIHKTNNSLGQLEAAHGDIGPQVQLCLWRMAQREKRPLREQVRDGAENTLEQEKNALVDVQKRLAEAVKRTQALVTELEDKLQEVNTDIEHKLQALGIDETCLRNTVRSFSASTETTPPSTGGMSLATRTPRVPSDGRSTARSHRPDTAVSSAAHSQSRNVVYQRASGVGNPRLMLQETSRNEQHRQQAGVRLAQVGTGLMEKAKAIREENAVLMARCQKTADEAVSRTERFLQDRVAESQQVRRRLEAEIQETKARVEQTKDLLGETRARIRALEEPAGNAANCASFRRQRATREHIHDPVSTKIQEHQLSTIKAQQDLLDHHAQEKMALLELNERLARLNEDLADKTAAMNIDQTCLMHSPGQHVPSLPLHYSTKSRLAARRSDLASLASPSIMPVVPMTAR